ncbi:MAG: DNA mismatch repair endonuclease MutL [Myxococcales bacterium]|nr:DNA mismatch repair endonuclease MutL [Myxococcales bacterium]
MTEAPSARVELLPPQVANQIAAGEVVVRPSSVVKELVDNAIDARARTVRVEIGGGGIELVRVSDDGHGMSARDARLALERHATSKLRVIEDLAELRTFGFRGEALAAIASVSRLCLRTRRARDAEGSELRTEGGAPPAVCPAGGAPGTVIEVSDLFFNVPARRKFLRATATEAAHVGEVVQAAALGHPEVVFTLARDGRAARSFLRAETRAERVRAAFADVELFAFCALRGPLGVEAYLSAPGRARTGAGGLTLLVNGRPVQDRALARAVAVAYGAALEPGRYPLGVVYLDLPPALVDVNVHPQKAEVRFAEPRAVSDAVYAAVAAALPWAEARGNAGHRPAGTALRSERDRGGSTGPEAEPWQWSGAATGPTASGAPAAPAPLASAGARLAGEPARPARPARPSPSGRPAALRLVGVVAARLVACEAPDELWLCDAHALAVAERAAVLGARGGSGGARGAGRVLFPARLGVTAAVGAALAERAPELARLGVLCSVVGGARGPSAVLEARPELLGHAAPDALLAALVASAEAPLEVALAALACAATPSGVSDASELEALVAELGALAPEALAQTLDVAICRHGPALRARVPLAPLLDR